MLCPESQLIFLNNNVTLYYLHHKSIIYTYFLKKEKDKKLTCVLDSQPRLNKIEKRLRL